MMNVKSHHLYSDKFTLSVINLKQIGVATEKDKAYQLSAEEIIRQQCEAREDAERVLQGMREKQERETARADAAEARAKAAETRAETAEARAEAAEAEAKTAKAKAEAAEMRLNIIEEDFKHMREEMEALKQRP